MVLHLPAAGRSSANSALAGFRFQNICKVIKLYRVMAKIQGQLFVISAPSGAGKTTIAKQLIKRTDNLYYSVSHTTRKPRKGEIDGIDYYFVSKTAFTEMIHNGEFLEWADVYGEFYGTSRKAVTDMLYQGKDILLDLDIQGAKNIKGIFSYAVLTFILPPSIDILYRRLVGRGTDSKDIIDMRKQKACEEIRNCSWFDYVVINEDIETAIRDAQAIIFSCRCRFLRQKDKIKSCFPDLF